MIRWTSDMMINYQPMDDQKYTYQGQLFESKGGYWIFNGQNFGALSEVKTAIENYVRMIHQLVAMAADN